LQKIEIEVAGAAARLASSGLGALFFLFRPLFSCRQLIPAQFISINLSFNYSHCLLRRSAWSCAITRDQTADATERLTRVYGSLRDML